MNYTIFSATYANPDHTSAVAQTAEAGAVLFSLADTPAEWAAMLAAITPTPFVPQVISPGTNTTPSE